MGILGYQSMWGSRTPKKIKYRGEDFHFLRSQGHIFGNML